MSFSTRNTPSGPGPSPVERYTSHHLDPYGAPSCCQLPCSQSIRWGLPQNGLRPRLLRRPIKGPQRFLVTPPILACLILAAALNLGAATGTGGLHSHQQAACTSKRGHCQAIPRTMALCHGIEYSEMRLPNLLGHETTEEVLQQAGSWVPLVQKRCHPDTKKFLCSLFAPVCIDELAEPIQPCRSLCEQVKRSCAPVMSAFGFPWPDMLKCNRFPEDNDLCIPPADSSEQVPAPRHELKICDACTESVQNDEIAEKYCKNDIALKIKVKAISYSNRDTKIVPGAKSKTIYKLSGVTEKDLKGAVWLKGGLQCACHEMNDINAPYLVMGQKIDGNLVITSVKRWQKGQRDLKRFAWSIGKQQC
ncbi:secreted frizzled-related protein 2 [Narcine bancroftii]|uniref:secreted frizzled-related protein 2 n=1 Tax=Narcine bancroftii TaxID=1343680 RepID=UPI003831D476